MAGLPRHCMPRVPTRRPAPADTLSASAILSRQLCRIWLAEDRAVDGDDQAKLDILGQLQDQVLDAAAEQDIVLILPDLDA